MLRSAQIPIDASVDELLYMAGECDERLAALETVADTQIDLSAYRDKPVEYASDILSVDLTPRQEEILRAVLEPPYRVLVPSGHDIGKTFCGAVLASWWYDTRDPSVTITTAPSEKQVKDLLWKELRYLRTRAGLGGFSGPKSLRLESSPKHFAKGETASGQAGLQGQHEANVLVIVDEAEECDRWVFDAAKSMASGPGHAIVCLYNPYTSSSHVAQEEQALDMAGKPSWRMLPMSSLDHPNIHVELAGGEPDYPQAIRLAKVEQWIADYCQRIEPETAKATDFEWRGKWYKPGPKFEGGMLGRRPTLAVDSVWSVSLVDACIKRQLPNSGPLQIGVDVARFGDDDTCFHVRKGGVSLAHQAVNGWNTVEIVGHVMRLCSHWSGAGGSGWKGCSANQVSIAVDDCGVGGGVVDLLRARGFNVHGINAATAAPDASPDDAKYPNLRSALWCDLADEASKGNVSFAELPWEVQQQLRRELPSQQYKMDARGRRVCLPKEITKQALGRSPDNADALMLAYCRVDVVGDRVGGRVAIPGGM